ncbi:MAG TPA: Rne/Rng family ribonuclease, partial [Candidatus Binatia bacterium]|nr:Rne/Rng family ribonuclease [Candidatus Binatia bacterium]
ESVLRKQIIINSNPNEVRVALLENGILAEVHIERASEEAAAGNIYKGRVLRVLPGMQAAFVDIGLEKAAFLHASDVVTGEPTAVDEAADDPGYDNERPMRGNAPIETRLRRGDEVVVQIAKEPMGTKGARITMHVSLPGKYLVYMPFGDLVGVSKRIGDDRERRRLREIISSAQPGAGGIIARTACQNLPKSDIVDDIRGLEQTWRAVQEKAQKANAPALLHADLDLVLRSVRDMLSADVDQIVVDSDADFDRTRDYVAAFIPALAERVERYRETEPIFDRYGVEEQISRAIEPKVWLRSGGYLVIDQGEALTMIDVNTGRYVGKKSQEETVLKTNLEAVEEIVCQLRLRNIGGIIILDLIDMDDAGHRKLVSDTLETALARDKARTSILRISELGLIQMTRKRTRENLERLLSAPCPYCDGRGRVKSVPTIASEILRAIQREVARTPSSRARVTVRANRDVISYLFNDEEDSIRTLQDRLGRGVVLKVAENYHQEQYDVMPA